MSDAPATAAVYLGDALSRYHFGAGHPFGPYRLPAFQQAFQERGLDARVAVLEPVAGKPDDICRFHEPAYVDFVRQASRAGAGYLDQGDTPAFAGIYDAAAWVAGTTVDAVARIMDGHVRRAFVPIAGLHHAYRDRASGFCVFNDCAVAVALLQQVYGLRRVGYVDIDAHHGDGVFYGFESDPGLVFADIHEDGRFLFPGTGGADETGRGAAAGTKLNIPLQPGADDSVFHTRWPEVEGHLERGRPEFILLQCGADSVAGDPLTHMAFSAGAHRHAAERVCALAERYCGGRVLALGGGGYNPRNIAAAWNDVVEALVQAPVACT